MKTICTGRNKCAKPWPCPYSRPNDHEEWGGNCEWAGGVRFIPVEMSYIEENTFAAACCENSIDELKTALEGPADETDMAEWGITETEWRAGIQQAIVAKQSEGE